MTEQLDSNEQTKLKQLYKKYSTPVIVVICLILVAVVGWQYWQKRQLENNAQAAQLYQKLALIAQQTISSSDAIISQAQNIIDLYPQSIYADFAHFEIAKQTVKLGHLDQATLNLSAVIKQTANTNIKAIAQARLARIEIAQNKPDQAISTLNNIQLAGFELTRNQLLGNAYFAKKDYKKAKSYWQKAIEKATTPELATVKNILQMKVDNLAALETSTTK